MLFGLLILFLCVAAGGATLALLEAHGRSLPLAVGVVHGGAAVVAIVLLVMQDAAHPGNRLVNVATVVFMLTAAGGLLLFAFRATRQRLPAPVVLLHAGFALTALVLLGAGWLRS